MKREDFNIYKQNEGATGINIPWVPGIETTSTNLLIQQLLIDQKRNCSDNYFWNGFKDSNFTLLPEEDVLDSNDGYPGVMSFYKTSMEQAHDDRRFYIHRLERYIDGDGPYDPELHDLEATIMGMKEFLGGLGE